MTASPAHPHASPPYRAAARRAAIRRLRIAVAGVLAFALLLALPLEDADAHGGRIIPKPPVPGDGGPRPPPRPPPPPPHPPKVPPFSQPTPTTPRLGPGDAGPLGRKPAPVTPAPKPNNPAPEARPPTTATPRGLGGTRRGTTPTAAPDATWEMWWDLNRWNYYPERQMPEPQGTVVTPRTEGDAPVDREALARMRRDLVTRQHIVPFLLSQIDPKALVRPEVRAAAMIALAKVSHDDACLALLLGHARDRKAPNLVRESAAYALGMLRRSETARQLPGGKLDDVRSALLTLVDDDKAPVRTRAFAAFSIGLLGDQPFGSAFTKGGQVITRGLWTRVTRKYSARDVPVALLTALGMQPASGCAQEVKQGLLRIVHGRRVGKRAWDSFERSHALTALVRQRASGWHMTLMRTLTNKRLPKQVRRAAFIALAEGATALDAEDRPAAMDAAERGVRMARDGLTRGLGQIAVGRLLAADTAAGKATLVDHSGAPALLLGEADHGSLAHRGFSALALALALRGSTASAPSVDIFRSKGLRALQRGFERTKDPVLRGAYAAALGVAGADAKPAAPALIEVLEDRSADPVLRGHSALALAQMGVSDKLVRRALRTALWDKRSVKLRSNAALALSFMGGSADTKLLVRELKNAKSRWVLSQVAVALGQLGDVDAVPAVLALAGDEKREDEARALAIASLGLLGDPEVKPSTLRLTADSNYPSRTDALHEAFTLL